MKSLVLSTYRFSKILIQKVQNIFKNIEKNMYDQQKVEHKIKKIYMTKKNKDDYID